MKGIGKQMATKCRACGKDILFIETALYKKMPVDAEPVYIVPEEGPQRGRQVGTYILPTGGTIRGQIVRDADIDGNTELRLAYVSHFATCTNPERFRKRGEKREMKASETKA